MARQVGFEIVYERDDRRVWEFEDTPKYIEFLRMHTMGKFGETHFHVDPWRSIFVTRSFRLASHFALLCAEKATEDAINMLLYTVYACVEPIDHPSLIGSIDYVSLTDEVLCNATYNYYTVAR